MRSRMIVAGSVILLAGLVGAGWWLRAPLVAWYSVRGLVQANEANRDVWVERVASLGDAAIPSLLERLVNDDPKGCENVGAALDRLGSDEEATRRTLLAVRLSDTFDTFSPAGKAETAALLARWLVTDGDESLMPPCRKVLELAAASAEPSVHTRALDLAVALPLQAGDSASQNACRVLARSGLRDGDSAVRARAVHAAAQTGREMLEELVPLLDDPAPEVRQAAMLTLGPAVDVIATDDLLRWLHDPDEGVRRLCEATLRGPRRLPDEHVMLGRLLTDEEPSVRLQVLETLREVSDLEPGVWLRRLSHDPAPAVRVAAIRAAVELPYEAQVDLRDRLDQMARSDPNPTVSNLARYYLSQSQTTDPGKRNR